jgi:hypothetical protein
MAHNSQRRKGGLKEGAFNTPTQDRKSSAFLDPSAAFSTFGQTGFAQNWFIAM